MHYGSDDNFTTDKSLDRPHGVERYTNSLWAMRYELERASKRYGTAHLGVFIGDRYHAPILAPLAATEKREIIAPSVQEGVCGLRQSSGYTVTRGGYSYPSQPKRR